MNVSRRQIFSIATAILIVTGVVWFTPRSLSLYYQIRGGQALEDVIASSEQTSDDPIACTEDPLQGEQALAQLAQAKETLQSAVGFHTGNSQAHLLLARTYCYLGDPQSAVVAYQLYTKLRPQNPLGHIELGFAHQLAGDNQSAVREWQVGNLKPREIHDRASELRIAGKLQQAIKWYDWAILAKSKESRPYLIYTRGLVHESQQQWSQAIQAYEDAIEEDRELNQLTGSAYFRIGYINQEQTKDWGAALQSYGEAIIAASFLSDRERADAHFRKGIILEYGYNDHEQAMQEFQTAVDLLSYHYGALMEIGWAHWKYDQNFELSERMLKRAVSANPNEKWAYLILGNLYLENRLFDQSLEMYQKAKTIDPDNPVIDQRIAILQERKQATPTP